MQNVRKIVKVFIASPGDLNPERKIAREVVEEFNSLHADSLGYQIEMVGWEETVGSMGRPQEIINKDFWKVILKNYQKVVRFHWSFSISNFFQFPWSNLTISK